MANVLIGCEFSGRVRDLFLIHGSDAVSCDLEPSEEPGPHLQMDVEDAIAAGVWDVAVFFPPCTYLAGSGLHHNKNNAERRKKTEEAIAFVERLWSAPIPCIAIENPVGCLSTKSCLGKPTQIIHPWQFGDDASKATCLWLKGLPKLKPTALARPRMVREGDHAGKLRWANQTDSGQNCLPPSKDRAKIRSRTYWGIADAMGKQWRRHAKRGRPAIRLTGGG